MKKNPVTPFRSFVFLRRAGKSVKAGFTIIELAVVALLFCLLLGGVIMVFQTDSKVERSMGQLDALHHVRQGVWQLSREIVMGTKVLFPPLDPERWYPQLLFTDFSWRKEIVYLDSRNNLKMAKTGGKPVVLAANIREFKVKRVSESLVVFSMKALDPISKKTFLLSNSLQMQNLALEDLQVAHP